MAKKPQKTTETKKTTNAEAASLEPRTVKRPKYRSFRLQKRIKGEKLPNAFRLMTAALRLLTSHWKLFLAIALLYSALNFVLVQGFHVAGSGVSDAKSSLDELFTGGWGQLASGLTIFAYLLGSSGSAADAAAGSYQLMLILIVTLATIWTVRQVSAGHKVGVRDGFYRGMSPLVQFVLVLLVISLQLIPMVIGLALFGTVAASGIAVTGVEQMLWALLAFGLSLLSLYMVSSSIFALYIVTLPDMTPVRALRSARQLVANRRWPVLRKVLFLPLALIVAAAVITVPVILFATPFAPWVFFLLSMLVLPIFHAYVYTLYRALL